MEEELRVSETEEEEEEPPAVPKQQETGRSPAVGGGHGFQKVPVSSLLSYCNSLPPGDCQWFYPTAPFLSSFEILLLHTTGY